MGGFYSSFEQSLQVISTDEDNLKDEFGLTKSFFIKNNQTGDFLVNSENISFIFFADIIETLKETEYLRGKYFFNFDIDFSNIKFIKNNEVFLDAPQKSTNFIKTISKMYYIDGNKCKLNIVLSCPNKYYGDSINKLNFKLINATNISKQKEVFDNINESYYDVNYKIFILCIYLELSNIAISENTVSVPLKISEDIQFIPYKNIKIIPNF